MKELFREGDIVKTAGGYGKVVEIMQGSSDMIVVVALADTKKLAKYLQSKIERVADIASLPDNVQNKLNAVSISYDAPIIDKQIKKRKPHIKEISSSNTNLDRVIPLSFDRQKWINDDEPTIQYHDRIKDDDNQREKYSKRTQSIEKIEILQQVVPILKAYISKCIPEPYITERYYWSLSFKPYKTLLFRLNMRNQEVFSCYCDSEKIDCFTWHLRRSIISPYLNNITTDLYYTDHFYDSGGSDQMEIQTNSIKSATDLLNYHYFLKAVKDFNISLMDRGIHLWTSSHCFQLADLVMP